MKLTERALETNLPADFSMLEIGVGSFPFSPRSYVLEHCLAETNTSFVFSGQRKYVGVDNGSAVGDLVHLGSPERIKLEALRNLSRYAERIKLSRPGQNIEFIFADILEMPEQPSTFNTAIMNEVLSSNIGLEGARLLLDCAAKLLVKGGLLVTREAFTPDLMPQNDLVELMLESGFSEAEAVPYSTRPDEYNALRDHYGRTLDDTQEIDMKPRSDRYFCIALK